MWRAVHGVQVLKCGSRPRGDVSGAPPKTAGQSRQGGTVPGKLGAEADSGALVVRCAVKSGLSEDFGEGVVLVVGERFADGVGQGLRFVVGEHAEVAMG